ncbi:MAG: hypothetical protein R3293_16370 [Candidatus Promineifilaceae bacterium]|nr:hypothetical protein [Candidatus Promineifilaceae bacterium]
MAEVEHLVLTAGHDVAKLHAPIQIDVSQVGDEIVQMSGRSIEMRLGDMIMRDAQGISCSIIYGQDNRSPITLATTHVLYIAYGPPGITAESITAQFEAIKH